MRYVDTHHRSNYLKGQILKYRTSKGDNGGQHETMERIITTGNIGRFDFSFLVNFLFGYLRGLQAVRKVRDLLKEKDITHQIRNVLKTFGIFHYKNHGGLGSAPGLPDITGCLKDGRGFWIEVKTDKGRLSPHQERFIQNINDAGGLAFVARSVDDVIEKLDLKKRMLF